MTKEELVKMFDLLSWYVQEIDRERLFELLELRQRNLDTISVCQKEVKEINRELLEMFT